MSQKSDFLLKETEELISKAKTWGVDLVVCGGLAIHILSDFFKRSSPRAWNHKDIDLLVPLSQLSLAIAFFKDLGFVRAFVSYKKTRLIKNHIRFGTTVQGHKVLVDIYGTARIQIVRIERGKTQIAVFSPRLELENWVDRRQHLGPKPSIDLSIGFLKSVIEANLLKEIEIT